MPDWWIYGAVCAVAGILNAFSKPGCPFWRILASGIILMGTIETLALSHFIQSNYLNLFRLFLVWSIR
jgi:hypothetical protein